MKKKKCSSQHLLSLLHVCSQNAFQGLFANVFPNCLCVLVRSELLFVCVHHELSFGVKKPSLVSSVAHVFQLSWLHMCACVLLHALYPPSVVISALCETGTLPRCTLTQLIYFASQSCRQFRLY